MFKNSDYRSYFEQLYAIEEEMEREAIELKAIVINPTAQALLESLRADEVRHKEIVKSLLALIPKT